MALLATLSDLKAELGITNSAQDTRLTSLLRQASDAIELLCDRRFERRTLTETFQPACWPRSTRTLYLSAYPVVGSITLSVAGTSLGEAQYVLDLTEGTLRQPTYGVGYGSPWGYDWGGVVTVTYTGGYILPGSDGANLPGDIERACLDLAIRNHHGASRDPTLRSEVVPGVIEQSWSASDSVPVLGGLPLDIAQRLIGHKRAIL